MLVLPADTTATFVGDVHLGDGGASDIFGGRDADLVGFLEGCGSQCEVVVFMGDALDLPQALSVRRIASAHREAIDAVQRLAQEVRVVFIRGNHDWRVDYETLVPGSVMVERLEIGGTLVWHGHALDETAHADTWGYFAAMAAHSLLERAARFHFRVPLHDHDTTQNRIMHWLGHSLARVLDRRGRGEDFIAYWSRAVWGDPGAFFEPISEFLTNHDYDTVVCGHTHLPGVVDIGGCQYVNAGSWTFGAAEVARFDGHRFTAHDVVTEEPITDENYRWMLAGHDPGDFFDWWNHHHRGGLKFGPQVSPTAASAAVG